MGPPGDAVKQLVQSYRTGVLCVEEAPVPALRPVGVLVRNAYSLISPGTERAQLQLARASLLEKARQRPERLRQVVRNFRQEGWLATYRKVMDRLDAPVALGYCSAGVVEDVGREVEGIRLGDRVACAGEGHGSHADVVYVPRTLCARVPENVSLEHAAFAPLGAIALESLRQAQAQLGQRVGVIGTGLVGLLIVQLLEAAGCHVLATDLENDRIHLARELGAEQTCEVDQLEFAADEFTGGRGLDAVILVAAANSAQPVELAGRIAREAGRVVVVGAFPLQIPRQLYYEKQLTLAFSRAFGPGSYDPDYIERARDYPYAHVRWTAGRHLEEFLRLLARGRIRVEPLITHRFPIERASDAYRLLEDSAARPLGIMFSYQPDNPVSRAPIVLRSVRPTVTTQQIRLGVIGAGKFAQTYLLPHLRRPHVRLLALATATAPSASYVARKFGFEQFSCDAENVIADPAINCVLIATRHDLHARLTCAALAAGKAVLVEKPLALTEEELCQLARVARQTGARLQVGFNRRFSPLAQRVHEHFHQRQGPLVLTYRVNAAPLPPQHWVYDPVEGGGRIRSEVCHFIDLLSFFAAAPPVRVYAEPMQDLAASLREDENLTISLKFSDGSTGSVTYTTLGQAGLDRERIEVFGGHRAAHIDNFRRAHLHQGNRRRRIRHWRQNLGYREELDAFLSAVATGAPMPIPLDHLLATSLATLRVVESLQRRQPVEVNLAALDSQHD